MTLSQVFQLWSFVLPVLERNMSQNLLNTCKILILLYHWIWRIWYKLYPADTINIHGSSFSTLRPRLTTNNKTLTRLVSTFIHIYLINTLHFVMDLYDNVSMTVKDLHCAFMINFVYQVVYIFTSDIIGGFDLLLHMLPSNLARWLSSVLTCRSYYTCVYLLLFIGSFILLYSCMMCYNLAHPIKPFSHCHSITLCTTMQTQTQTQKFFYSTLIIHNDFKNRYM